MNREKLNLFPLKSELMEDIAIYALMWFATFCIAALTVPTGFGLATLLTPVVLFVVVDPFVAIGLVALIHGWHNCVKLTVLRQHVDLDALRRFGFALLIGALIGAVLHIYIQSDFLLFLVGCALIFLPLFKLHSALSSFRLPDQYDRIGGFASGFMGGLTGHQGALRAMFLHQRLTDKAAFSATAATLAIVVDFTRIPIYFIHDPTFIGDYIIECILLLSSAFFGVQLGKRWLQAWSSKTIQSIIYVGLVLSGIFYIVEPGII